MGCTRRVRGRGFGQHLNRLEQVLLVGTTLLADHHVVNHALARGLDLVIRPPALLHCGGQCLDCGGTEPSFQEWVAQVLIVLLAAAPLRVNAPETEPLVAEVGLLLGGIRQQLAEVMLQSLLE